MAEYRRFVAYVYEYLKGKKGSNCGFIRVEAWGKVCRMEIHLRCPIVPGCNDTDAHFSAIAALADRYSHITRVDLEPYHALGTGKDAKLGKESRFVTTMPDKAWMVSVRDRIAAQCDTPVYVN